MERRDAAGKWVLISNLRRPFTHVQLKEMLAPLARVTYFRLNTIKTHCFLELESAEKADSLVAALQGKVWPETGLPLILQKISQADCIPPEDQKGPDRDRKFRKTKAQPQLYWAPISEAEVKARDSAKRRR